jgi:hypothetical protein
MTEQTITEIIAGAIAAASGVYAWLKLQAGQALKAAAAAAAAAAALATALAERL